MPFVRVSLLRRFVLLVLLVAVGAPSAAVASTGGAGLPSNVMIPSEPQPEPAPDAAGLPGGVPGPDAATPDAQQVTLSEPVAALPVLAAAARRPEDPTTQDLAALGFPSSVAAIDGHIVIVRPHMGRSELVDVGDPGHQRVLLVSTRTFGTPTAGRDADGRPVIVVSPCAGVDEVVLDGDAPRCPLRAIDLTTTESRALPSTTGALAGDMAGTRLLFTRPSPQTGVRLYESSGSGTGLVSLPALGRKGTDWNASLGEPYARTLRAPEFDVDASGRVAVVLEYRSKRPTTMSALWVRATAGSWKRVASVGTTFSGLGTRHVLGPRLDATGVSAYVEGVIESPSYIAHWTDEGAVSSKMSIRRTIGRSTILADATYDGERLLFIDWLPGAPCGSEGAMACGLRSAGPLVVN